MLSDSTNDDPITLPIELVEEVAKIVYDHADDTTLRACALTCRLWSRISRRFIFRRIKIVNENRLEAFESLLSSDPVVGRYVRELIVQPERGLVPEPSEWIARFPSMLSSQLTQLQAIQLVRLYEVGEYVVASFFHDFARFRSVSRLTVRDSSLALRMIYAFACALPSLRDLRIGFTLPMPTSLWDAPPCLHNPSLSSIEVHIGDMYPRAVQEALKWTLSTNSYTTLHSLSVLVHFAQARAVTDCLSALGDRLHHLRIQLGLSFDSPFEYEMIKDDLSLHSCTGLRSLTLHSAIPACVAILALLTEVSSPEIRQVNLHISSDLPATLPDCRPLEAPLNGDNLRCLDEICFMYDGPLDKRFVMENIREDLPSIHSRGLVRVTAA